jgi:hypothetical protein
MREEKKRRVGSCITFPLFFCALVTLPFLSHSMALVSNLAALASLLLATIALPACCLSGLCCILPIMEVMLPFNEEGAEVVSPLRLVTPVGVTMVVGAPVEV